MKDRIKQNKEATLNFSNFNDLFQKIIIIK